VSRGVPASAPYQHGGAIVGGSLVTRHLRTCIAIAAAAVAAQGCQADPADPANPGGGPDVSGRWAMFAWEDPVAVDIAQAGSVIEGQGCCAGFPGQDSALDCCGAVMGQILERRASFGFSIDGLGEPYIYSTDVFVSADGSRMAGTFSRTGSAVAWVKIGAHEPYLPSTDPALGEVIRARTGSYVLVLSDDPAPGDDFAPGQTYRLTVGSEAVAGQLGSFWSGEISWSAGEQTLVAGPVPETAPGLPVAMSLHFDAAALGSVEAVMASGVRYQFRATRWQS
jgi:hypothetical protein